MTLSGPITGCRVFLMSSQIWTALSLSQSSRPPSPVPLGNPSFWATQSNALLAMFLTALNQPWIVDATLLIASHAPPMKVLSTSNAGPITSLVTVPTMSETLVKTLLIASNTGLFMNACAISRIALMPDTRVSQHLGSPALAPCRTANADVNDPLSWLAILATSTPPVTVPTQPEIAGWIAFLIRPPGPSLMSVASPGATRMTAASI
jgi:hypothetical protein